MNSSQLSKKSTPLQSSKYGLFFKNTRGGGANKFVPLESATSEFFSPTQLQPLQLVPFWEAK
jgi:hypothetical protein